MIQNRLSKSFSKMKKWLNRENIAAYRLYDKDIPEYPFIVDVFPPYAIVYEQGAKLDKDDQRPREKFEEISLALQEVLNLSKENIIYKQRGKKQGLEQYEKIENKKQTFVIEENGAKFIINPFDYLDPGLFLDHRPMRKEIRQMAKGKSFLNLFAYTGSVSVAAALGGAQCTTVDLSNTYIKWAKDNFLENGLDPEKHKFIKTDVLEYVKQLKSYQFDLIFIDPPTFSNSKSMKFNFEVEKDHEWLLKSLGKSLKKNGIIIFSNNKKNFKISPELSKSFSVIDISYKSIPQDFRNKKIHQCFELRKLNA